jgi:hypothetical protein
LVKPSTAKILTQEKQWNPPLKKKNNPGATSLKSLTGIINAIIIGLYFIYGEWNSFT